jgi:glyoxylase-like metal-dependent hydrolase (beta-lactamase superfamily II)
MNKLHTLALMICASLAITSTALQAQSRTLENVTGDVYRFTDTYHHSMVTVTDDGVVVVDPISPDAASWLKENLNKITDKPITHLIYSHSHDDHARGGPNLGAKTVIAHSNAPETIFDTKPTQRFKEAMSLETGGKTFEMTWLGLGHSNDLIAVVVRPENVGFIVDAAGVQQLPYRDMPHSDPDGMIEQIRKVETLDFDIFVGGHGSIGKKEDVIPVRTYLEELRAQVLAGLNAGKSVQELIKTVTMDEYKSWGWVYDNWRAQNIQGMARHLKAIDAVN